MSCIMTKPTKWHVRPAKTQISLGIDNLTFELRHDKTNKMDVRPAKTQISLGIRPVWSVFAVCMKKAWSLATLWAQSEDSDQTGQMPRLMWVFAGHTYHFVGVVMMRLVYPKQFLQPYFMTRFVSWEIQSQFQSFFCLKELFSSHLDMYIFLKLILFFIWGLFGIFYYYYYFLIEHFCSHACGHACGCTLFVMVPIDGTFGMNGLN